MAKKFLKTCVMAFPSHSDTYEAGDWAPYTNLYTAFNAGQNYQVYQDALTRRGYTPGKICTITNGTDTVNCVGHGFSDGDAVSYYSGNAGADPGNITRATRYYVRDAAADTFKLSLTVGGGVHNISSDGTAPICFAKGGLLGTTAWVAGSGTIYPTLHIFGEAVLDLYSLFDLALVGHAPHKNIFKEIKRRSRRPKGTKVGLYFFQLETYGQGGNQNTWFNQFDGTLQAVAVNGSGVPAGPPGGWPAACTGVDAFQTNGSGTYSVTCKGRDSASGASCTHVWMVDLAPSNDINTWITLMRTQLALRYDSGDLDYVVVDNCVPTRSQGTATNYSAGNDAGYYAGQIRIMNDLQNQVAQPLGIKVGGNGTGWDRIFGGSAWQTEASNPFRYDEFFFQTSFSAMLTNLMKQKEGPYQWTSFVGHGRNTGNATTYNAGTRNTSDRWFHNNAADQQGFDRGPNVIAGTDSGNWPRLAQFITQNGLWENTYIVAARTGTVFHIAHDAEFGPVD